MSSISHQNNVQHLFVCNNLTATVNGTLVDAYTDIQDGETVILDTNNTTVLHASAQLTASQKFRFARRVGTSLIYSPWLWANKITGSYKAYTAPVQQVTHIGYVGSGSGNIQAIDENEYIIRLLMQTDTTSMYGNKQMYKFGAYKSGTSAVSADIAIGLAANLYYNFKREPEEQLLIEAISSGTTTASSGGVWTVVKGSTKVVVVESSGAAADAGKYNSDGSTLVAGDFIRFGHATTTTYPVYKVASISGAGTATCTIYLDRPYTGATNAALAAASVGCMANATGIAANWGLQITGVSLTKTKAGVYNYEVVQFKAEPQNCGTTEVTYTTAPVRGIGVRAQVQEIEWFAQGNIGNKWRITVPPATMYDGTEASPGTYNMLSLKYKDQSGATVLGDVPSSNGEILFALSTSGTAASGISDMATHMGWI